MLISQDRWISIWGEVNDVKTITVGQWLRDMELLKNQVTAVATVLAYLDTTLTSNATRVGKVLLMFLLIASAVLLTLLTVANQYKATLRRFFDSDPTNEIRVEVIFVVLYRSMRDQGDVYFLRLRGRNEGRAMG